MRNLQDSLSYLGVASATPPNFRTQTRAPLTSDYKNFNIGDIWLQKATENVWMLTSKAKGVGTWTLLNSSGSVTYTDITITPGDLTITDGDIHVDNGDIYIDNGGLQFGAINYISTLKTLADGTVYGLPDGDDGELLIGATGLSAAWGSLTSSGTTVTITKTPHGINLEAAGGTAANIYTTDDANTVLPTLGGNVFLAGGSNLNTTGAIANTATFNLNDTVSISGDFTTTGGDITVDTGNIDITAGDLTVGNDVTVTNDLTVNGIFKSYIDINTQTGTTYTFQLSDASKEVQFTNGLAVTATIPTNVAVSFPIGTHILIVQYGAGTITLSPDGGVTLNSAGSRTETYEQYSACVLIKQAPDIWGLFGDIK